MRSKLSHLSFFLLTAFLASTACKSLFPDAEPTEAAIKNFELFYEDLRHCYPFFPYDKVDWEALGREYKPQVTASTTDDELFTIMTQMLAPLMDGHASLTSPSGRDWANPKNAEPFEKRSFSLGNILLKYRQDTTNYLDKTFFAFRPRPGILYIYIPSFLEEGVSGLADDAIRAAERTGSGLKGLILDVRDNGGGYLLEGEQLAGLFTDKPFEYVREKYKNGPDTADYTGVESVYIQPYRSLNFTKPAVLLTNRYTASTSERLRFAVEQLPNFTVIGDTTYGATSPIIERGLPNGFTYVIVGSVTYGLDNKLYERVGIPPQIRVVNVRRDLLAGRDNVLDRALSVLP